MHSWTSVVLCRIQVGDPTEPLTLCGPLVSEDSKHRYLNALDQVRFVVFLDRCWVYQALKQGCELLYGGCRTSGLYVKPALVEVKSDQQPLVMMTETFGPILYVKKIRTLDEVSWREGSQSLKNLR